MRIVGLTGFAQSGKDTVAASLRAYRFERVALADKVREYLYVLNPMIGWYVADETPGRLFTHKLVEPMRLQSIIDSIGWDEAKVKHPEVRELQQRMGTELGRKLLGEDFWIRRAEDVIAERGLTDVVITDVRFKNEVDWIRSLSGVVVRIDRPGTEPVNSHISDTGVAALKVNAIIVNDGTFSLLDDKVKQFMWATESYWGKGS